MKKFLTAVLTVAIMLNLLCGISVFAAYGRQGVYWFDRCYEDTYTIDMNFKKTSSGKSYGFEVTAPGDESNLQGFVKYTANAMFQFTQSDELAMRSNPNFITPEKENDTGLSKFAISNNVVHNLKLRFLTELNKVEYYLDGHKIHEAEGRSAVPCNGISFFCDSADTDGFWWEIVSVTGNAYGSFSAQISDVDEEEKKVTVSFSEIVEDYSFASGVVLKNVNGGEEYSMTLDSSSASSAVFSYSENLDAAAEYAVVFPESVKSSLNSTLKSRYCYFTTNTKTTSEKLSGCDYNDGKAGVWASASNLKIVEVDEAHGKSMAITKHQDTGKDDNFAFWGITFPDKDVVSFKFEIMPLHDDMQLAMRFQDKNNVNGVVPINFAFCKSGDIIAGRHWFDSSMTNVTRANASYKVGTYQKDNWYTVEVQYDRVNCIAKYFINGTLVKTLDKTVMEGFSGIGQISFAVYGTKWSIAKDDVMFNFDNIYWYEMKSGVSLKKMRASDIYGNETGAFGTISRSVSEIKLYFEGGIDSKTVNNETVKISYDGNGVEYDGTYDDKERCYTIVPANIPKSNASVEISVDGVKKSGSEDETVKYETYFNVEEEKDEFSIYENTFVNDSGKVMSEVPSGFVFSKMTAVNKTDSDKKIIFTLSGYKNKALCKFDFTEKTVKANSIFRLAPGVEVVSFDSTGMDFVEASIETNDFVPVAKAVSIGADSIENGEYEVSKKADAKFADKELSVYVYAPNCDFSGLSDASDIRDVLIYKGRTVAGSDGSFKVTFNVDYADAKSGEYLIKVFGDGVSYTESLFYCNPAKTKSVFENQITSALKDNDAQELADIIFNEYAHFGVNGKYVDEKTALIAANILIEKNKKEAITLETVKKDVNLAVGIGAVTENMVSDIIAEKEMFDLANTTLSDYYEAKFVDSDIKKAVMEKMSGKTFETIDDFYNKFYEAFALSVVENPKEPNSAVSVLNKLGIKAKYNKSYLSIWNKTYSSLDDVKTALSKADLANGGGGSGGGSSTGGGSSSKDGDLNITIPTQPDITYDSKDVFIDLSGVLWAKEAILGLYDKGIVSGKYERYFCPNDNITREEFTKLLVVAFDIKGSGNSANFSDVVSGEWYETYVSAAVENGIVMGKGDGIFGVGENITRQDMAVMIARALKMSGIKLNGEIGSVKFEDHSIISDYALEAVCEMKNYGIVNGNEYNCFAPKAYATRAEAAKMIYGVVK